MGILELKDSSQRVITIFGSSRPRPGDAEYMLAQDVGARLAREGFAICNGGYRGTMEASARGAKEAGGRTIAITTGFFAGSTANQWIDKVVSVPTLHERLLKLIESGDGYVVLKGGTGTLLELAASWEYMNKGVIKQKPIVLVGSFWNGVVDTLKRELAWEGLEGCIRFVSVVATPADCAGILKKWFLNEKEKG